MLGKLFHKKIYGIEPKVPRDSKLWPIAWKTKHFKNYARFKKYRLPKPELPDANLKEILEQRHSSRNFTNATEMTQLELATLLHYSAGIKGEPGEFEYSEQAELDKTKRYYPSGGSHYPIETYCVVRHVTGIPPGIYHYNVLEHSLALILPEMALKTFDDALWQDWFQDVSVMVVFTAIWNRSFEKYLDRGYALVLLEGGHIGQNLLLVAESMGLKHRPFTSFTLTTIDTLFDFDEMGESTFYMIGVSK